MLHIYYGDGKGKSTAAFGLCVRAAGSGYSVIIAQFLKSRKVGELNTFEKLENVALLRGNLENVFSFNMNDEQKAHALSEHNALFKRAVDLFEKQSQNNEKTLLILDEAIGAITEKLLDFPTVLEFLKAFKDSEQIEIVITGRNPPSELLELGDYITEMKNHKHPYDSGVKMRKGIEF